MEKIKVSCEIEVTMHVIGGKYKPLILNRIITEGMQRFGELKRAIPQISQRTLTNQLRELENDGLISRTVYAQVPLRVEYSVTETGMTLSPILEAMCTWGMNHAGDRFELTTPQCVERENQG